MLRTAAGAGCLASLIVLTWATPASADAGANASCIGLEASSISPVGVSDEFPGGMAELQRYLKENVGTPTGSVVSAVAHEHLGSHAGCDAGE